MAVLDEYGPLYSSLSKGKALDYSSYAELGRTDEKQLIQPTLFPRFLERVLRFTHLDYIPEQFNDRRMAPDFTPLDTQVHPFIFETKGMDSSTQDLCQEFVAKSWQYLEADRHAELAIITNMRELVVFSKTSGKKVEDYSFSFLDLYRTHHAPKGLATPDQNTKNFLSFVKRFHRVTLDNEARIRAIEHARPRRVLAEVGMSRSTAQELTDSIRQLVESLKDDAKMSRGAETLLGAVKDDSQKLASISREIRSLSKEVDPSYIPVEEPAHDAGSLRRLLSSRHPVLSRAVDLYFYRVAHFTVTRLLLLRVWEDAQFVEPEYASLYNGGFKKWYDRYHAEIGRVLEHAYRVGKERYRWLFTNQNTYAWYVPTDEVLLQVLYELAKFELASVDRDVLGTVYEEYLDRQGKKTKGQYFTPHPIVSLIWDRLGYTSSRLDDDEAFFRHDSGGRHSRRIFDPCSGSGSFIVEAIVRLRRYAETKEDRADLEDVREAILSDFFASEISEFPYYLTEINILIQLTPIIQRLIELKEKPRKERGRFTLKVLHQDSLALYDPQRESVEGTQSRPYVEDPDHNIWRPEGEKELVYNELRSFSKFDYVASNPPYLGEDDHKEVFQRVLHDYSFWRQYYQGKMDYLYFFVILGLEKLRRGGRLGFITTSYWLTADGASKLREHILKNAKIVELVDFGETKLFEHAPGQHNLAFVLEKWALDPGEEDHDLASRLAAERGRNRIKVAHVKGTIEGGSFHEVLENTVSHVSRHLSKSSHSDAWFETYYSPVRQEELSEKAWHLFVKKDVKNLLDIMRETGKPLSNFCDVDQGVVPNPLRVDSEMVRQDPSLELGEGVFVLTSKEVDDLELTNVERHHLKPYFKNTDIRRYHTPNASEEFLLYLDKNVDIVSLPNIQAHLRRFQTKLRSRRETENGKIPWYSLHWAREQRQFEGRKIVCPYRTSTGRPPNCFGFSDGPFYGSTDMYFLSSKRSKNAGLGDGDGDLHPSRHDLLYVLGVLNSAPLRLWAEHMTKAKGEARELMATPVEEFPIPTIKKNSEMEQAHYARVISSTKTIIEVKDKLAALAPNFGHDILEADDPTHLPRPEPLLTVSSLPPGELSPLKKEEHVEFIAPRGPFIVKRVGEITKTLSGMHESGDYQLEIRSADRTRMYLFGDRPRLELVAASISAGFLGSDWTDIERRLTLPKDFAAFSERIKEVAQASRSLVSEVQHHQRIIDRSVCALFGVDYHDIARFCDELDQQRSSAQA